MKKMLLLSWATWGAVACAGESVSADAGATTTSDATGDVWKDVTELTDAPAPGDSEVPVDSGEVADAGGADVAPAYPLVVKDPLSVAPDPLEAGGPESCAVLAAERCEAGQRQVCGTWSTVEKAFGEPDALLRRALMYDRWYDLYQQPDGQTANRIFTEAQAAGTPEAAWGAPAKFADWDGAGDSAIWTGTALTAYLMRYAVFGTAADKARVTEKTRRLLTMFDVTGIPGYLARYHYLSVPAETPRVPEHIYVTHGAKVPFIDAPVAEGTAGLPAVYASGLGTPMWHGNPSIDQYSGPMTALPMAFAVLDDPALRARITTQLTCYLKRLRKVEIINLQANPDAVAALQGLLGGGTLELDEGDIDFGELESMSGYYLEQPNSKNADTFDRSCPETMNTAPARVLDAGSETFLVDLLTFGADIQSGEVESKTGIDHIYMSVRGGDAAHLIHMGVVAYYLTGDEQYRTWLQEEVLGTLRALDVADTAGAFVLPPWCSSFYGHHITFTPWWGLLELLGPGPLRGRLEAAFHHELWERLMSPLKNAKFEVMYAGALSPGAAPDRDLAAAEAVALLEGLGGNGGELLDPRRSYAQTAEWTLAHLPEGVAATCPTEAERERCEGGFEVLGIVVPGESITKPCTGGVLECPMAGGECAEQLARPGTPSSLRVYEDFIWQRSPHKLRFGGDGGRHQAPGLDLTESYWMARYYGLVDDPKGFVLAWQDAGSCAPD